MRRLPLGLAFGALLLALFASTAAAAGGTLRFGLDPGAKFPDRRFTLTLPSGVEPYDVHVAENGVPVIPHLKAASASRVPLSLAVVIDSSDSMHGAALDAAKAAALQLLSDRPERSESLVVAFAKSPDVISSWNASPGATSAAVASLETSHGTALWDAVVTAAQQLRNRPGVTKAIVLLTDGADTSSSADASSAAAAARRAGIKVFAVALPGVGGAQLGTIDGLAQRSGGELVQVDSLDKLSSVYAAFAQRLAHQYVLTYDSQLRGAGKPVTVTLRAGGYTAQQRYTVPGEVTVGGVNDEEASWWTSTTLMVLMAVVVGAIILTSVYLALRPVPISAKQRLLPYGSSGSEEGADLVLIAENLLRQDRPKHGLAATKFWQRFVADITRGGISRRPRDMMLLGVAAGLLGGAVVAVITGVPVVILGGPPIGVAVVVLVVRRRATAWYEHFDSTLADSLTVLASSLRAGHSLLQAVSHVAEESDDLTKVEWDEVVRQTRLGVSVEDALDEMVDRVGSKDMRWLAMVARVQHQVGGNMAEMFDIVAETVRERHQLRAQVRSLTAQGRMTRWILTFAPLAIGGLLFLTAPVYVVDFLNDLVGRLLILGAFVLMTIGTLWLKRIVEVEV